MQLLIVHRDPEMGEALVQMVKSYTRHQCQLVGSDSTAMDWARPHPQCNLLLTQFEAEGIDGLALGSSLRRDLSSAPGFVLSKLRRDRATPGSFRDQSFSGAD